MLINPSAVDSNNSQFDVWSFEPDRQSTLLHLPCPVCLPTNIISTVADFLRKVSIAKTNVTNAANSKATLKASRLDLNQRNT